MIRITANFADLERSLTDVAQRQLPFAMMMALNDTAAEALDAVKAEMEQVFDRPTRWTLNAFMVWRASKTRLEATVGERPSVGKRHYLKVQASGGVRPNTGLERLVRSRLNYAGTFGIITPAKGARLDGSGNWSGGQRNQVLSAIKAQRDVLSNTTAASRKRAGKRAQYFVPRPGSKLSPGVWERADARSGIAKVVHFAPSDASYSKRFAFEDVSMEKARARFPSHLATRMRQALASAR